MTRSEHIVAVELHPTTPDPTTEVVADPADLRRERLSRALVAVRRSEIDLALFGREGNARYVGGAPRLWTAGSRPFTPSCVLVAATGEVHLLSTWDEGIPEEIDRNHLYPITFNPARVSEVLRALPGAATARRVGIDSWTPMFAQLLAGVFPTAELVDAHAVLQAVRADKTPAEVEELARAADMCRRCLAAVEAELGPGRTPQQLTGVFMAEMARAGVTTPGRQDVVRVADPAAPWRFLASDRPLRLGDVVVLTGSVVRHGYLAEVGHTTVVGEHRSPVLEHLEQLRAGLLARCRPGATGTELLAVYDELGLPTPPEPIARGLGLGFDPPVVDGSLRTEADTVVLRPGMVLAVVAGAHLPGHGSALAVDPVLIDPNGAQQLLSGDLSSHPARRPRG